MLKNFTLCILGGEEKLYSIILGFIFSSSVLFCQLFFFNCRKPLQPATKKKSSPKKRSKNLKSLKVPKYDTDESGLLTEIEEDQRRQIETIRKEWAVMMEEFQKEEKAKYEQMVKESSTKLKEQEALIQ